MDPVERARHALEVFGNTNVLLRDIEAAEATGWRMDMAEFSRLPATVATEWRLARLPADATDADIVALLRSKVGYLDMSRAVADGALGIARRLTPEGMASAAASSPRLWARLALFERLPGSSSRRAAAATGYGRHPVNSWVGDFADLLAPGRLTGLTAAPDDACYPRRALAASRSGLARVAVRRMHRSCSSSVVKPWSGPLTRTINGTFSWLICYSPPDAAASEFLRRRDRDYRRNLAAYARWRAAAAAGATLLGRHAAAAERYARVR